jgi:endonuclease G
MIKKIFLLLICCSNVVLAFDYLPTSTTGQMVKHAYYTLSYAEEYEQAEWVAYELTKEMLKWQVKREDCFKEDTNIKTGSAELSDYRGSGFDRGHLVPAADMRFNLRAMQESFFLSNISPQKAGFNRDIWKKLEQLVRRWTRKNKRLYIVTGSICKPGFKTIGANEVAVPAAFYKIILDYKKPDIKAIAFLIPHKKTKKALKTFVVTIDEIEERTKIDFFAALPDALEERLESGQTNKKWWQ